MKSLAWEAVQRARRRIATALALLVGLGLSACSGADQQVAGRPADADVRLTVRFDPGADAAQRSEMLACTAEGARASGALSGRGAARLCAHARQIGGFLASEPERDRVCAAIYGGPQTARITGTIGERRVDRAFERTDGCQIAGWDEAVPLLPAVDSAAMPQPGG